MKPTLIVKTNDYTERELNQIKDLGFLVITNPEPKSVQILEIETLRDKFAVAALKGLLSNKTYVEGDTIDQKQAATHAYIYADAMLAERNKT